VKITKTITIPLDINLSMDDITTAIDDGGPLDCMWIMGEVMRKLSTQDIQHMRSLVGWSAMNVYKKELEKFLSMYAGVLDAG